MSEPAACVLSGEILIHAAPGRAHVLALEGQCICWRRTRASQLAPRSWEKPAQVPCWDLLPLQFAILHPKKKFRSHSCITHPDRAFTSVSQPNPGCPVALAGGSASKCWAPGGEKRVQQVPARGPHHPPPRAIPTPLISRIPTNPQTLPSPAPGPQLTQDSLTLSASHAHHVSIQSTTPLKPHLTPSALSPHLPFPSLQLNKGTVTITVPRGRPARCPLSATDLFPTDRRGPPRAAPPPSRSSCMFDGPACINCNFVRRVTVRWFHRALAIVIIYWLSVMYLLVTKC